MINSSKVGEMTLLGVVDLFNHGFRMTSCIWVKQGVFGHSKVFLLWIHKTASCFGMVA